MEMNLVVMELADRTGGAPETPSTYAPVRRERRRFPVAAGQRTWRAAKAGVERFAPLQMDWEGERGVRSLREDLVFFLEQYRDKGVIGEDYDFVWILFVDDTNKPEVELRFMEEAGGQQIRNYSDPDAQPSPVREATVIEGAFLGTLADMLRKVDAKAEDATA